MITTAAFMARYHRTHPGRARLMGLVRMSVSDDLWGESMGWWFGLADAMWHADIPIPADWHYRHAPGCDGTQNDWPDSEVRDLYLIGDIGRDDIAYVAAVMARYTRWLERAGHCY